MAHLIATRPALPTLVLCKLTADAWSSFLTLIELTGDDRVAAGLATTLMQARLMLWLEEEALRTGTPALGEVRPA